MTHPRPDMKLLLTSPRNGLTCSEAVTRLENDGPNKIDGSGKVSIGAVLLRQVSNSLTIVSRMIML